jgi:hypothetical protein
MNCSAAKTRRLIGCKRAECGKVEMAEVTRRHRAKAHECLYGSIDGEGGSSYGRRYIDWVQAGGPIDHDLSAVAQALADIEAAAIRASGDAGALALVADCLNASVFVRAGLSLPDASKALMVSRRVVEDVEGVFDNQRRQARLSYERMNAKPLIQQSAHHLLDKLSQQCGDSDMIAELHRRYDALQEANYRQAARMLGVDVSEKPSIPEKKE